MKTNFFSQFAVTYNCNSYGAGAYNNGEPCVTGGPNQPAPQPQPQPGQPTPQPGQPPRPEPIHPGTVPQQNGGTQQLVPTGESLFVGIGVGILLIVIALVLLLSGRRKARKQL